MAFTLVGVSSTPADNGSQAGPNVTVAPVANMQAGDFVFVVGLRRDNTATVLIEPNYADQSGWGGQRWSTGMPADGQANLSPRPLWCQFNGTWTTSPSFRAANGADDSVSTLPMSIVMVVFRPSSQRKFIVPCILPIAATYAAAASFAVTGITTVQQHGSNSHLAIALVATADDNTWSISGGSWTQTGLATQYRNLAGSQMSLSLAYLIQTSSGATGNVTFTQATNGNDAGCSLIMAFTEIDLPAAGTAGTRAYVQSAIAQSNDGEVTVPVTLDAPVTSGYSVSGHFNWEDIGSPTPIFPPTSDQGDELIIAQVINYRGLNQNIATWFRPNITSGAQTFTLDLDGDSNVSIGASAVEFNGGMHLHQYTGTWGFPNYKTEWTPLSAGSMTTRMACAIYAAGTWPGQAADPPQLDFSGWGTKREEIGNDSPFLNIMGCATASQGAAGAINVTELSTSSTATALMALALSSAMESAALTGTAAASISESDIVAGGKTIILTLTGDTFVPATVGPNIQHVGSRTAGFAGTTTAQTVSLEGLSGGDTGNTRPLAGDLVIVTYAIGSTVARTPTIATPGGGAAYTNANAILQQADNFDVSMLVAYKFMGDVPDTQVTLSESVGGGTGDVADAGRYTIQVFRGVDPSTPLDVAVVTGGAANSSAVDPGAITPSTTGAIVVAMGAAASGTGSTMTSSNLTDFVAGSTADTNDVSIGAGYSTWASGSFNPAAFGNIPAGTTANSWVSLTIALRPRVTTPFADVRSSIRDGLDSAQSEAAGWDAKVKPNIPLANIVRTSDTVCTITLHAQADYDITAQETITATIPGTALTGGLPIVATPTFTISAGGGGGDTNAILLGGDLLRSLLFGRLVT